MKTTLLIITGIIGAALLALLAYSIERTAWLLSLYEVANDSGTNLALMAALVAELGAVALIVAEGAMSLLDHYTARQLSRWAHFGLVVVLALQSAAGLIAGYVRGGARLLDTLGAGDSLARFGVTAVALLLSNLAVPALILALSKIAALLVGRLVALPRSASPRWYDRLRDWWQAGQEQPRAVAWARPAPPLSEATFVQTDGVTSQNVQTLAAMLPETFSEPARDRTCKYCHQGGLTAMEVARHGKTRARTGECLR